MGIVLKWNFKNLLADIPRLILTLLSIASTFAILVGAILSLECFAAGIGGLNEGLPHYIAVILPPLILAPFASTVYVLFSVLISERKNQFFLLQSSGGTAKQLRKGLLIESLALDATGGVVGVGLGVLLAWSQAAPAGYALTSEAFFSTTVFWSALLPAFAIVPLAMLLASFRLNRQKTEKRRKPPKKNPPALNKRLFPRLFGVGGALEYTLDRHGHRHRSLTVASVVINIGVLFLLTGGISILSSSAYYVGVEDGEAVVSLSSETDEQFEAMAAEMISRFTEKGLISSSHRDYSTYVGVVANRKDVQEKSALYDAPSETVVNELILRMDEDNALLECRLCFIPDEDYARFAARLNIPVTGIGGIYCNEYEYMEWDGQTNSARAVALCRTWKEKPNDPLTIYALPIEFFYGSYWIQDVGNGYDLQKGAREKLTSAAKAKVTIDGLARYKDYPSAAFGVNSIVLPDSMRGSYAPLIAEANQVLDGSASHYIIEFVTDNSVLLNKEIKTILAENGYNFDEKQFGDGMAYYERSAEDRAARREKMVYIYDQSTYEYLFNLFVKQIELFYKLFAVMIFVSILLNIVNIVHMNRTSHRKENAILTSLGISEKQRLGMLLYESFRFTLRVTLLGIAVVFLLNFLFYKSAGNAYVGEGLSSAFDNRFQTVFPNSGFIGELLTIVFNVMIVLKPYWWFAALAVLLIFTGYVLTELVAHRHMDQDDIIPIIKDDMYE